MTPVERLTRIEQALDKHIEFVGASLIELGKQVDRTAAAQEVTETRLQTLIVHLDRVVDRVDKLEGPKR